MPLKMGVGEGVAPEKVFYQQAYNVRDFYWPSNVNPVTQVSNYE